MAQNVEMVNRTSTASPYIKSNQQSQNTKELFDLLRPDRMGGAGTDKQKNVDKSTQQIIEKMKQQLVSKESDLVSAGLKKLLDTAVFLNNKAGVPILKDKEMQQMMLKPEMLLRELTSQQKGASIFKGELFDNLRSLLQMKFSSRAEQATVKEAVVNVLRQYANAYVKAQKPSGNHASLRQPGQEATPNNINEASFRKAADLLQKAMNTLSETLKQTGGSLESLRTKIEGLAPGIPQLILNQIMENRELQQNSSLDKILDLILTKLEESTGGETVKLYGEQIVRGLLNTNTINQPILHFVLPLLFEDMSAFAEMWVDPDAENPEGEGENGKKKATRIFLTVDLEEKGKAEIDIILSNNKLYTGLYYPREIAGSFETAEKFIANVVQDAGFSVGVIHVEPLEASRPLDEIISKPLERRMALDAKA